MCKIGDTEPAGVKIPLCKSAAGESENKPEL